MAVNNPHIKKKDNSVLNTFNGLHTVVDNPNHVTSLGVGRQGEYSQRVVVSTTNRVLLYTVESGVQ